MIVVMRSAGRSEELLASTMAGMDYASLLRTALMRSFWLVRERDPKGLRERVLRDAVDLLGASVGRFYDVDPDGGVAEVRIEGQPAVPALACEMEAELLPRALARGKSLISSHPLLDRDLVDLGRRCQAAQITTHVLLLRAYQQNYGAAVVHWLGKERPVDYNGRSVFYAYWENAGLAVATAHERAQAEAELAELRHTAYRDRLTGLPNDRALQQQLDAHAETSPFSVLMLDFDGLRAANAAYGYVEGGDVLINVVATGLAQLAAEGEFVARMNSAGDEFVILLPGQDANAAQSRRSEIESSLQALPVPAKFDGIYHGASVGTATRRPDETAGQTLGRAIKAMRTRKTERNTTPRGQ